MPLFGAHNSIAGGLHKALETGHALGMEAVQLFTANQRTWQVKPLPAGKRVFRSGKLWTKTSNQWRAKELNDADVSTFQETLRQTRLRVLLAHDSYLINMASPDELLYRRSLEAFIAEMQRAERLGLTYLVTHPGAHVGSGEESGLRRFAAALDEVHHRCTGFRLQILLETTAGQGSCLGYRFEHLARILELVAEPERLGICLDTCHVFAAGYGLSPKAAYQATMRDFDRLIGLQRLRAFHLNDSLKPLGSRIDRHAHIGQGCLGLEAFRLLVNDPRFQDRPMVLETPKEETPTDTMDAINLRTLRGLLKKKASKVSRNRIEP
jgi:deoxyribonuclease-4